ncbi:hypothetical protein Q9233_001111 [Columba guinea]|nr:hypothetical protein Q9233_001111 [Columba guinea]
MAGQKVGAEIDKSSCIWRMNNAPTKGYEEDVGKRTTVRVVSHTSVPLLLKNPEYFFKETNNTVYVIWGPFRNMRKDGNGIVYNMLKRTVESYPTAQIYVTTEKRMSYCDAVFKKETGKDRQMELNRSSPVFINVPESTAFDRVGFQLHRTDSARDFQLQWLLRAFPLLEWEQFKFLYAADEELKMPLPKYILMDNSKAWQALQG